MNISVVWASGSIAEWNTTFLSSDNGKGAGVSKDFLDLADVTTVGVVLVRRYYPFDSEELRTFTNVPHKEQKVLVSPDEVRDILTLSVDGKLALARVVWDDEGRPVVSQDGVLCNMLLPDNDVVQGVPPTEPDGEPDDELGEPGNEGGDAEGAAGEPEEMPGEAGDFDEPDFGDEFYDGDEPDFA